MATHAQGNLVMAQETAGYQGYAVGCTAAESNQGLHGAVIEH
jgi:hypothetical protein